MEALNMTSTGGLFQCYVADLPKNDRLAFHGNLVVEGYLSEQWIKTKQTKGITDQKTFHCFGDNDFNRLYM